MIMVRRDATNKALERLYEEFMDAYETVSHAFFKKTGDIMRNAAIMDTLDWVTSVMETEMRKVE